MEISGDTGSLSKNSLHDIDEEVPFDTGTETVVDTNDETIGWPIPDVSEGFLVFDFETIPDFSREHLFDLPPLPPQRKASDDATLPDPTELVGKPIGDIQTLLAGVIPSDEWTHALIDAENSRSKPRKGVIELADKLVNRKHEYANALALRMKTMSTTPEMLRICSAAWLMNGEIESVVLAKETDEAERDLLDTVWEAFSRSRMLVGYNIIGFDLPALMIRSALLRVKPAFPIDLGAYSPKGIIDVAVQRFGKRNMMGLKPWSKMFGVDTGIDDNGALVLEMWQNGEFERIRQYNESDVIRTAAMFAMLRGYFT